MTLKNSLLAVAAAVLLGAGAAAIADDATTNPSPEPRSSSHSRITAPFNLLTDLTDDQKSKIREIHSDTLEQERQLRQKEHDEITAILTDDQKKELDDLESKESLEKKASSEEKRAKEEEEKAQSLKGQMDGGATTQPAGNQ